MKKPRISPALFLFILAPAMGELLSGSSPPVEFFNPINFTIMAILYGGGALIVRELLLRWGKSWPSLLALGAAYGIIEEGVMVQSFFNPYWVDLGNLATYGRWIGVNWIWTIELIIFHAVVSISIPITLTTLLFPGHKEESWLNVKWFRVILILFGLDILAGVILWGALNPQYPMPWLHVLLAALLSALLIMMAKKLPVPLADENADPSSRKSFFLAGFTGIFLLFFFSWFLPELNMPVIATFMLLLFLPFLILFWIMHLTRGAALPPRRQLALCSGVITLMAILDQVLMLDPNPPDNRAGMWLVGLFFLGFMIWMDRKLLKDQKGTMESRKENTIQ